MDQTEEYESDLEPTYNSKKPIGEQDLEKVNQNIRERNIDLDNEDFFGQYGDDEDEIMIEQVSDEEDLIGDHMEDDYKVIPQLDTFEKVGIDNTEYDAISIENRRLAEREMEKRDKRQRFQQLRTSALQRQSTTGAGGSSRLPMALAMALEASDDEASDYERKRKRRRKKELKKKTKSTIFSTKGAESESEADSESSSGSIDFLFDKEGVATVQRGPSLREWLQLSAPRKECARLFQDFLTSYTDTSGNLIYQAKITAMCAANKKSLLISFKHLSEVEPDLALWVADEPNELLTIFNEVAKKAVLSMFPEYEAICAEIHVRLTDFEYNDSLRDLREIHLNKLVKVSGVVTRRTSVFPQLMAIKMKCMKCHQNVGPFTVHGTGDLPTVTFCPSCQQRGHFIDNNEETIYRNYQKITLQEAPGDVPPGRIPRSKEVLLLHDLIDTAVPGEEIEVIGFYKHNYDLNLNRSHGFPVFATMIEGNYISKKQDIFASFRMTEEDEREILALAKDEQIGERIIQSIAPSICGHTDIKTALAFAMFGGETRILEGQGGHRIRGDINVLLMGDPGTAKSQFLKYIEKTAHRAVYTTGKGSTAVGLTAAVRKDHMTKEWTLEGGALVLADRGMCLIDEFDKMNDKDRTSIHEAMEQQSISISKAGIVTALQARCSVVAAANPVKGRYDPQLTFSHNVQLSEPIVSRFDIICVVKDIINPVADEQLAEFVVRSHKRSHPDYNSGTLPDDSTLEHNERILQKHKQLGESFPNLQLNKNELEMEADNELLISQSLLKKYIMYAKQTHPRWTSSMDKEKISNLYVDMRRESQAGAGILICTRHVESMMRMAEAHAKMHLREYVREDDVNMAIRSMLESFISIQKFSVARTLRRKFLKYITYKKDNFELLLYILQNLVVEKTWLQRRDLVNKDGEDGGENQTVEIEKHDFETRARESNIADCRSFYRSKLFRANNFTLDEVHKKIFKQYSTTII